MDDDIYEIAFIFQKGNYCASFYVGKQKLLEFLDKLNNGSKIKDIYLSYTCAGSNVLSVIYWIDDTIDIKFYDNCFEAILNHHYDSLKLSTKKELRQFSKLITNIINSKSESILHKDFGEFGKIYIGKNIAVMKNITVPRNKNRL